MISHLLAANIITGPGIDPGATPIATLENIISTVIGVLTIVAVIYFAIQTIFAGYNFFSTKGDAKKMEEARERLTDGVLGLFIVVVALGAASLIARLIGLSSNILNLQVLLGNLNIH